MFVGCKAITCLQISEPIEPPAPVTITTFSIILGAIVAKGSSTISRIYHGLRGYSNLQLKLRKLGIKVKIKT